MLGSVRGPVVLRPIVRCRTEIGFERSPPSAKRIPTVHGRVFLFLDAVRGAKSPDGIVGVGTVMVGENPSVPTIPENRPSKFPDIRRRQQPARRFRIEISQFLKASVLIFRQRFDAHGFGHVGYAIGGFVLFSRIQRLAVVTKASAAFRTLRRAVEKDVFARISVILHDVGFSARPFHFEERKEVAALQFRPNVRPIDSDVAVRIFFETGFQYLKKLRAEVTLKRFSECVGHAFKMRGCVSFRTSLYSFREPDIGIF